MVLVLGGILWLRLHPFLALVFSSLLVATLTPPSILQDYFIAMEGGLMRVEQGTGRFSDPPAAWLPGQAVAILEKKSDHSTWQQVGVGKVLPLPESMDADRKAIWHLADGDWAIAGRDSRIMSKPAWDKVSKSLNQPVGQRLAQGFGNTAGSIGLLIALASVVGSCLMVSGAASRIVHSLVGFFGPSRASIGFLIAGFVVGIPVFFDTVFYLMIPLAKAYFRREGRGYLLCVLSIVAGATMAHSLVPPTPGPMQVASELGVSMGVMMLAGLGMGIVTVSSGYMLARHMEKTHPIPSRDIGLADETHIHDERGGPPLILSVLPILLPVLFISLGTVTSAMASSDIAWLSPGLKAGIQYLANKNIAMALSAVCALVLAWKYSGKDAQQLSGEVQSALMNGGVILLITAAGGGFGQVLKETGITLWAGQLEPSGTPWAVLLAFVVTAVIRIAQGSATVAMVTAVGVVQPLVVSGALGFHPVYLALAIGCGSKPIPWMNDSGFWLISRMGGFTEKETLRTASVMMTFMGLVGGIVTFILAWVIPGV